MLNTPIWPVYTATTSARPGPSPAPAGKSPKSATAVQPTMPGPAQYDSDTKARVALSHCHVADPTTSSGTPSTSTSATTDESPVCSAGHPGTVEMRVPSEAHTPPSKITSACSSSSRSASVTELHRHCVEPHMSTLPSDRCDCQTRSSRPAASFQRKASSPPSPPAATTSTRVSASMSPTAGVIGAFRRSARSVAAASSRHVAPSITRNVPAAPQPRGGPS